MQRIEGKAESRLEVGKLLIAKDVLKLWSGWRLQTRNGQMDGMGGDFEETFGIFFGFWLQYTYFKAYAVCFLEKKFSKLCVSFHTQWED